MFNYRVLLIGVMWHMFDTLHTSNCSMACGPGGDIRMVTLTIVHLSPSLHQLVTQFTWFPRLNFEWLFKLKSRGIEIVESVFRCCRVLCVRVRLLLLRVGVRSAHAHVAHQLLWWCHHACWHGHSFVEATLRGPFRICSYNHRWTLHVAMCSTH